MRTMRKTVLVTGLIAGLASSATWAGGIQLCLTGDGCIGGSVFIEPTVGNTSGNMLLEDVIVGISGGAGTGTLRAHNSFSISSFTGFASELTIDVVIPITTAFGIGGIGAAPESISIAQSGAGTFRLFYDDLNGTLFATGGIAGNPLSGLGYTDGALIATGGISLTSSFLSGTEDATSFSVLSTTNATPTIKTSGGTTMGVDFLLAGVDANWIVNNIVSAAVDLSTQNGLTTPYDGVLNANPVQRASTSFTGGTVVPFYGADGQNDYNCGANQICDFQGQMNTTIAFVGDRIPEPATVALMGAALAFLGGLRRRRNRKG